MLRWIVVGICTSPHMYTASYYSETEVLFQDGVLYRVVYEESARGETLYRKKENGDQRLYL